MVNMSDIGRTMATNSIHTVEQAKMEGASKADISRMVRSGQIECATCASRKYQDGSNEQVSFKSAAHISPEAAPAKVRAHEQEHVSNAYDRAEKGGGQVLQASVAIKTAICPECGRSYVAGGLTTTRIKYNNDGYAQGAKTIDSASVKGANFEAAV